MPELFIEIKYYITAITVILNICDNKKTFFPGINPREL